MQFVFGNGGGAGSFVPTTRTVNGKALSTDITLTPADVGVANNGLQFTSDTASTTDADPGSGKFRWDNATQSSATKIYISKTSSDTTTLTDELFALAGQVIRIKQNNDTARWQAWAVIGVLNATNYIKLTIKPKGNGTAIQAASSCSIETFGLGSMYLGSWPGELTAIGTLNANGTAQTVTIDGLTITQTYDATTGQLTSESTGGLTRTYTYDASGTPSGVTGALIYGGYISGTWANVKALIPSEGTHAWLTDYKLPVIYINSAWVPDGVRMLGASAGTVTRTSANAASDTTLTQIGSSTTIPGDMLGLNGKIHASYHTSSVGATNSTFEVHLGASGAGTTFTGASGARGICEIQNNNSKSSQRMSVSAGATLGGNTGAPFSMTENTATDLTVTFWQKWAAQGAGLTFTLEGFTIEIMSRG